MANVNIGDIYHSKNYGDFTVTEYIGIINKYKYYKIQFSSGGVINANYINIIRGEVKDPYDNIDISAIQYSNYYGPFIILDLIKDNNGLNPKMKIRFIKTGTEKLVDISNIKDGYIKDEFINPLVINPLDTNLLQPNIKEYRIRFILRKSWHSMRNRCYNNKDCGFNTYGAIGVRVCDRWLNSFDNFYNDAKMLPQYEKFERWPTLYQFDKDYRQLSIPKEQRIYSPETCMFLYYMDNSNIRIYEYQKNHMNELTSQYYGVSKINDKYRVQFKMDNNKSSYLGKYTNEIVAANIYNHFYEHSNRYINKKYEIFPLLNNVPYIPFEECMKYRDPPLKPLYTLINESELIENYKITKNDILN